MDTATAPPHLGTLLDLEPVDFTTAGQWRFRGQPQTRPSGRLFGGLLLAQALVAAGRTVPEGRPVHSMHGLFVRGADPTLPVDYDVEPIRDGGATSARRVIARQDEIEMFSALVSFQRQRTGLRHQLPFPSAGDPDDLAPLHVRLAEREIEMPDWWRLPRAIDLRHVDGPPYPLPEHWSPDRHLVWLRAVEELPDDPLLHAAVVAYASDMTLLEPVLLRHRVWRHASGVRLASLDHAMWFHREPRADDWLLYDQDCPIAEGGRVLGQGVLFDRRGDQVVTVAQEGLLRVPR